MSDPWQLVFDQWILGEAEKKCPYTILLQLRRGRGGQGAGEQKCQWIINLLWPKNASKGPEMALKYTKIQLGEGGVAEASVVKDYQISRLKFTQSRGPKSRNCILVFLFLSTNALLPSAMGTQFCSKWGPIFEWDGDLMGTFASTNGDPESVFPKLIKTS